MLFLPRGTRGYLDSIGDNDSYLLSHLHPPYCVWKSLCDVISVHGQRMASYEGSDYNETSIYACLKLFASVAKAEPALTSRIDAALRECGVKDSSLLIMLRFIHNVSLDVNEAQVRTPRNLHAGAI